MANRITKSSGWEALKNRYSEEKEEKEEKKAPASSGWEALKQTYTNSQPQATTPAPSTQGSWMDQAINTLKERVSNSSLGEWANRVSNNVQQVWNETPAERTAKKATQNAAAARRKQWEMDNAQLIDEASSKYEGPTLTERRMGTTYDTSGSDLFSNDWEPAKRQTYETERTVRNERYNPLSREERDNLINTWNKAVNGKITADEYQNLLYNVTKNGGIEQLYREQQADAANDREYGRQLRGVDLSDMSVLERIGGTLGGIGSAAGKQIGSSGVGIMASDLNRTAEMASRDDTLTSYKAALEQAARAWYNGLLNGADYQETEDAVRQLATYVGGEDYAEAVVNRVRERAANSNGDDLTTDLLTDIAPDENKIWENSQKAIADAGIYDAINKLNQGAQEDIQYAKDVNLLQNKFGDNMIEAGVSTIQNMADAALAATLGLSGTGVVAMIPFALRAYGGTYAEQMQQATDLGQMVGRDVAKQAAKTAGMSSAIEVGTEMMWGMVGAMSKVTGGGALDDAAQQKLTEILSGWAKTETGRKILTTIGEKALGGITEGLEEVIGDAAEQILKNAGIMSGEAMEWSDWVKEAGHSFATGALAGLIGETTSIVSTPLQRANLGNQLRNGALDITVDELIDLANAEGMENTSLAHAYSDLFHGLPRNTENLSDQELGKLYESYQETLGKRDAAYDAISAAQEKVEAGEELTRAEVNRITNNSDAVAILTENGTVNEEAFHGEINERREAVSMALEALAIDSMAAEQTQAENVQAETQNAPTPILQRQAEYNDIMSAARDMQRRQMLSPAESIRANTSDRILTQNVARSIYSVADAAERLGVSPRAQDVMSRMYDPRQDTVEYAGEMTKYYNQGKAGNELDISGIQNVSAQQAQAAYNSGRMEMIEEEYRNGSEETGLRVRNGVQGNDSQSAGEQAQRVEGGTGSAEFREEIAGYRGGRQITGVHPESVSAADLGIAGGSTNRNIHLVEARSQDVMKAKAIIEGRGLNFVAFSGGALEVNGVQARGYYDPSTNTVYVRADHRIFTAEQLARHEAMHDSINNGEVSLADTRDAMIDKLGEDKFYETLDGYSALYQGTGLSESEIFEEMICDAAGNMNEFIYRGHFEDAVKAVQTMRAAKESAEKVSTEGGSERKKETRMSADNYPTISVKEGSELAKLLADNKQISTIRDYLFDNYAGYTFNLSDGRTAIVDRSDTRKLANRFDGTKVAALSDLKNVVEKAAFDHETEATHNKFDKFYYYAINLDNNGDITPIWVNVGHGKFDGKNHIYDLTKRDAQTRPVGTALERASLSANTVAEQNEPVKGKFSMDRSVEMTKDLVALHNLSEDKLLKAIKLGGFPMPSIAVTKSNIPHTNFGDITLVMNRSTVDPEIDRRNTVYSADAWTPTFPNVEYEANPAAEKRLRDLFYRLERQYGREVSEALYGYGNYLEDQLNRMGGIEGILKREENNTGMMKAYLKLQGKDIPETVVKETVERIDDQTAVFYDDLLAALGDASAELDTYRPPRLGREWFDAHEEQIKEGYRKYFERAGLSEEDVNNFFENESWGRMYANLKKARKYQKDGKETRKTETDYAATAQAVRDAVDQEAYKKWLHEIFDDSVKSEGIYNGRDYYDRNGNRRSFSWTHIPVTLDNIAKAMATQNDGNSRNVSGFYGVKSLRAGTAERFKSIADMHKLEGRLKHLTQEEADAINDELNNRLSSLMQKILDTAPKSSDSNSFMEMDTIGNILMEISEDTPITIDKIMKRFKGTPYKVTAAPATEVRNLLFDVSQMPVNIFEAKPERVVRFDEVIAAIVPAGASEELVNGLKSVGVENVMEYEKDNEEDRLAKVNSVEGAKFSRDIDAYLQEQHKEYKNDKTNRRIAAEGVRDLIEGFARISTSGGEVDMAERRKDIRTLGNGISAQFVKTGRVNLNGTRIRSAEDLAQVGQIFRNPKFETLRYLYVKDGKIVGTDSVTAMLPGISPAFSKDFQEADLLKKIARTGADGVYLLHNHPSGDVTPSRQDFGVTGKLAETIQNNTKAKFMGHVVIDHETYAQIDVDTNKRTASWEQKTIPGQSSFDFLLAPSLGNENLGKEVLNAGAVAAVGKEVVNGSGYSAIIYASSKGYVRQLQEVSDKALKNNKQIGNYIRNQRVNSGAGMAFVYTKDRAVYDALVQVYGDDILTDVVLDGAEFKDMRKNVFQREGMYMGVKEGDIVGVHANEEQTEYSYGVTQKELNEYVDGAYSGTKQESIKKYLAVDERLVDDVSDEIPDIKEYSHALRDNDIRHIRNSHGEESGEKYPVTEDDIKAVPFIVQNYDKVIVKYRNGAPGIVYVKVADDNLVYYLEAVTDQYRNEKLLINKQMIKTGLEDIPNLVGLKDAIQKKQSLTSFLADLNQIHEAYAQSASMQETASTDNIVREDSLVKGNFSRDLANTELYDANRQLQKDVTELRRQLKTRTEQKEYWKGQTKVTQGRKLRTDDVTKLAREIIKGQESNADAKLIAQSMKELGEYLLNSQDENVYDEARLKAYEVAHDILANAKTLNTKGGDDFYSDFRTALKSQPIYVAPSVREEVAPDGWNDFRKAQFGTVNITADQSKGKSVDKVYHDLQATFGEWLLPEYITSEADQLNKILEVIETYRPVYENLNSYEMADAVEWTANEILTRIIGNEIRETNPTYADRMEKKLADQKMKTQDALRKVRANRDQKVASLKAHYQQMAEDRRNRKIDSEARTRLLNIAKRLNNKKLPRVTRALLDQYIGDLDLVSKGILGRTVKELETLRDWYDNWVEEQKAEFGEDFVPDTAIENRIKRLSKKRINDLTQEEVADLTTVLLNIEHQLRTQHEFIDSEERRDTYAAAMAFREDYQEGKSSTENAFARTILFGPSGKNKESGGDGLLTPERAMHRLGNYNDDDPGYKLGKELSAGQRKMLDYQMRANALFDKWLNDKTFIRSLAGKHAQWITVKGMVKGELKDVRITPAMRMSLYLHAKNEQNLNHIERGGVLIPNEAKYKKGEMNNAYKEGIGEKVTFSRYMIHEITSKMSEKEKAFADMAYWYFNNMSKDAINETSEKHKGWAIATVEKYFPIESSRDFLKADFGMLLPDGSVAGQGFLNERNVKSTNPIMLYDMNDVLTKSIAGHSRYYGLALPVQNLNKMMNVIMLGQEGSIRNMLLDEHVKYIDKMVRDVQTGAPGVGGFLSALRSNYAGGVLVLNGGVAVKQAASYPTAAAVLGYMPLVKALKDRNKKVDLDLIAKYTPLLWYRSKGYSTAELGDIGNRGGIASKVTSVKQLNWIQGVDVWTTTKLWTAAEYYVKDHNKALTYGTDAFYKAVAEVYNRVIEETQPNYTAMQRPGVLRSDNQLTRALNMFKTQPFQNANILIDAYGNMRAKARQNKANPTAENTKALKEARKTFARAVTSQALSAFTFALMQAIWDMARGKFKKYKDDDDEATFWSVNKQLLLNMVTSFGGMVPYGGTILEFIESSVDKISTLLGGENIFDQKFYGFSENSLEAANDLGNTSQSLMANIIKAFQGKQTGEASARNIVDGLSTLIHMSTGLPAPNVVKDMQVLGLNAWRFYERFNGGWDEKSRLMAEYASLRVTTDPAKYKSDYYTLLQKAWRHDEAAYAEIYNKLIEEKGFATESKSAKANVDASIKKWGYALLEDTWNNKPDEFDAMREKMVNLPGDPFASDTKTGEENIDAKIKEWKKEKAPTEALYQNTMNALQSSNLWDMATSSQQEKAVNNLLSLTVGDEKMTADLEGGKAVGLDETEYMLYKLALSMANPDGGNAKNAEYEEAINMVPGLSNEEKSYLWMTTHDSDKNNPWKQEVTRGGNIPSQTVSRWARTPNPFEIGGDIFKTGPGLYNGYGVSMTGKLSEKRKQLEASTGADFYRAMYYGEGSQGSLSRLEEIVSNRANDFTGGSYSMDAYDRLIASLAQLLGDARFSGQNDKAEYYESMLASLENMDEAEREEYARYLRSLGF